jgi:hypothetical protein
LPISLPPDSRMSASSGLRTFSSCCQVNHAEAIIWHQAVLSK